MDLINELLGFNLSKKDTNEINKNVNIIENNAKNQLKDFSKRSLSVNSRKEKEILKKDISKAIEELEAIKKDKTTSILLSSFKIVAGAVIVIPGSLIGIGIGLASIVAAIPLILTGILGALTGFTVAYGIKLIKYDELNEKTFSEVLDIQIEANKKILESLDD